LRPYVEEKISYEIFNLNTNRSIEYADGITNDRDALIRLDDYIHHGPHSLQPGQARNMFGIRRIGDSEPILAQPITAASSQTHPARSIPSSARLDRPFVWKVIGSNSSPYQRQGTEVTAHSEFEAMQKARQQWNLNTSGGSEADFFRINGWTATPVRPAEPSTQAGGTWTGWWLVKDANNAGLYRFNGVGNSQADANRVALRWLIDNGYGHGHEVSVVPEMS